MPQGDYKALFTTIDVNVQKLFAALVRLKRVEQELTQQNLADKAELSRPTLSKMESATSEGFHNRTVGKIVKALGISKEELGLLKTFSSAVDADDGLNIMLSAPVRERFSEERIKEIFAKAVEITSKSPDTSTKPEMFGRTLLAIAITQDTEALGQSIFTQAPA